MMGRFWARFPRWVVSGIVVPVFSIGLGFAVAAVAVLASGADPVLAYTALFQGAFTNNNAFAETLVSTVPYVFLGLGVALGFRAGLFNIGAEGQYYVGSLAGIFVAYSLHLPGFVLIPLSILAAMAGGSVYAGLAGFLKARFGAHEVITTIMLNYIAFLLVNYLVTTPGLMLDPHTRFPRTPYIDPAAALPIILPGSRLHAGFLLALLAIPIVWFLINRTTVGFRFRAVGYNPGAARAAGISVSRTTVLAMGLSGALAATAGIVQTLGIQHGMTAATASGYGFDAIAVALLARSNPWGILPAAFLFGALHNGASFMQLQTQVSSDLIAIVQASVIVFIAAPDIIRWLLRLRAGQVGKVAITQREGTAVV